MTHRNTLLMASTVGLIVVSLAVFVLVSGVSVRAFAADASYYPRVLTVARFGTPVEKELLPKLWASQTPAGDYGFITSIELHRVLWHLNYCTNLLSWPGCKSLPPGTEAQGIAKEILDQLSIPFRK